MELTAIDAATVYEVAMGSKRGGARIVRVCVVKTAAKIPVVENVHVGDARVEHVDVARITKAVAIPRAERFTKSQREPADSAAEAKTNAPAATSVEAYECRAPK